MNGILRLIDTNPLLNRLLGFVSVFLAGQRGLPMLAGTVLIVISGLATAILLPIIVSDPDVPSIWLLMCLPACVLHLGLFVGFLGFMLATPLGQGFGDDS